jgi:hypothetical protein
MIKQVVITSYFSEPTDLAGEMRSWPEFVAGEGYSVDLMNIVTGQAVTVRLTHQDEDSFVTVSSSDAGLLFDLVVGRVVYALSEHSDYLLVRRR